MQHVSAEYERILNSRNYYVESSLVVGERGVLITENAERVLFGGVGIYIADGSVDSGGYTEVMLISINTTKRVFKNNVPEVGCCPCGEIYVEMHQPLGSISRKAMAVPYVRLVSTDDGSTSEWIRKGIFYIDTRDNTHNDDDLDIVTFHGYDAMMFAEREYGEYYKEDSFSIAGADWTKSGSTYTAYVNDNNVVSSKTVTVEYTGADSVAFGRNVIATQQNKKVQLTTSSVPPTVLSGKLVIRANQTLGFPNYDTYVILDIADKMGVKVDQRSLQYTENRQGVCTPKPASQQTYFNKSYVIQYPSGYTMREVLGYIGAMYGGNWIMNDIGELQFIPIWDLPKETNLLIDDLGYYITFGGYRIRLTTGV